MPAVMATWLAVSTHPSSKILIVPSKASARVHEQPTTMTQLKEGFTQNNLSQNGLVFYTNAAKHCPLPASDDHQHLGWGVLSWPVASPSNGCTEAFGDTRVPLAKLKVVSNCTKRSFDPLSEIARVKIKVVGRRGQFLIKGVKISTSCRLRANCGTHAMGSIERVSST